MSRPDFVQAQYSFARIHQFTSASDAWAPSPIEGSDGMIYGSVIRPTGNYNTGYIYRLHKDGSGFEVLFDSGTLTGNLFETTFVFEASNGKLYGFVDDYVHSLLYRLNKDGTGFEVLRRFPDDLGTNGNLVGFEFNFETPDGWLYGYGDTAIFRCRLDGSQFTILHQFGVQPGDGGAPSQLILGSDGRLYGSCGGGGHLEGGTVFRIEQDRSGYRSLHEFEYPNAGQPVAWLPNGLLEAANGALVGVATAAGQGPAFLYNLDKDGSGYTNVLAFGPATQGATNMWEALVAGHDGYLYGRTLSSDLNAS